MNIAIPASKLRLSDQNVRKDVANLNIASLAADIAAKGLLANLVVEPMARPKGHYAVLAGGRRLRAIQHNIETGIFPKDYEVNCLVKDENASSAEISLSENFQREDMTPADEIVAFSKLAQDGMASEDIARRFGLDKRNVDSRLRLSHVATPILDALRAGKITLNHVKAYAQAPSEEAQLNVFENYRYWTPEQIHRHYTSETLSASDPIAKLVGEADYRAAEGRVELDLFNPEGAIWLDKDIAIQLATDKMQLAAEAALARDGYGWVKPLLATGVYYDEYRNLQHVHIPLRDTTAEEDAALQALYDQQDEARQRYDNAAEDSDEETKAADEIEALERQITAATPGRVALTPDALNQVGRFLIISADGEPVYDRNIYAEQRIMITGTGEIAEPVTRPTGGLPGRPEGTSTTDGSEPAPAKPALSAKLADELRLQRRDILAAHIASNPAIATDYLLFNLAINKMAPHSSNKTGSSLTPGNPQDGTYDYPKGPANEHLNAVFEALNTDWYNLADITERYDAFCELSNDDKLAWAAYVMSTTLIATGGFGMSADYSLQAHIAGKLGIDGAEMWRPTAANYFDRVKKDTILDALEQVGGETLKLRYQGEKKRDLATSAETIFGGQAILDPEVKEAAAKWMPAEMTFAAEIAENERRKAKAAASAEDSGDEPNDLADEEQDDDDDIEQAAAGDDDDLDNAEAEDLSEQV